MGRLGRMRGVRDDLAALLRVYRGDFSALERPGGERALELAVVLGAQVRPGGVPSRTLAARARHAGRMHARGWIGESGRIVVSGGVGEHPPSEAEAMARILVREGVPEAKILREAASHSTRQSARHVTVLARRRGIGEVVLVTDPLHCVRAGSSFRAEGLRALAEPVVESPMWRESGERRAQLVREVAAVIWYGLGRPPG